MGRPRLTRSLPPYASQFQDRHGKMRIFFRRTGFPTHYTKQHPGSDEFWREYLAWKAGSAPGFERAGRTAPGTFNDLISQYYFSRSWKDIPKESTRKVYRGEIERFRAEYGDRRVATMSARNVAKLIEKMGGTPSAANNLLKRLRQLFDYAILIEMRADNPAKVVKGYRNVTEGFHTWTEEEIEQYEAKHPLGSKARLALALLLYTAQRRSDVVTMGRIPGEENKVKVVQLKTGKPMTIPMHPRLRQAIDAYPSGHLVYLTSERGRPFSAASFGNRFRKWCDEADLRHCSAHGLRKAAARRMAEIGLSNQLIKSVTGHSGDSEVALYTRDADQARMAVQAMARLADADASRISSSRPESEAVAVAVDVRGTNPPVPAPENGCGTATTMSGGGPSILVPVPLKTAPVVKAVDPAPTTIPVPGFRRRDSR